VSAGRTAVVVGAGGREHALARALAVSDVAVTVTPGNPGMPSTIGGGSISIDPRPAGEIGADLYVIGPEVPLVEGLADALRAQGRLVVGPGADGARLEGSKAFMKDLLDAAGVPTARHWAVTDIDEAVAVLGGLTPPYVIKTDGLAAGKGVLVTDEFDLAISDVSDKLSGASFGAAGSTVVIEEGLKGPECSLIALCDGSRAMAFSPAQDFKRIADGDEGPNTGGMGAYSPMAAVDDALVAELMAICVMPTLQELRRRGIDYRGLLYAGLMLTEQGPRVIEFNVRFGDPEAQVVLPRVTSDLFVHLTEAASGELVTPLSFSSQRAVTVVLAAPGYPGSTETGARISGLAADGQLIEGLEGVTVFHAGTARPDPDGPFVVAGGRVLAVTGMGASMGEARARAYEGAMRIEFDGVQRRSDIAARAAAQEAAT
jgi:phosphoribosylamine--glycine ligase